jgi:hypothetical protein
MVPILAWIQGLLWTKIGGIEFPIYSVFMLLMISSDAGDPSVLGSFTDDFFLRGRSRGVGWIRGE